ncbi:hypothetical protein CWI38_0518p0020 [Hamiltosporidium tvaerminnensis]|uniref:Uncharacterized protein n=1 Tax=Hamiltosporidium tvaerminnensis TaxID=1176355 RepID=A0A4Q9LYX7_9MICR|nr:hypothetical protein CWI38_0518p0020 [Hamiltosporidium tvaerminnensis]
MCNSFSGKNTNENKYRFQIGATPGFIEYGNDMRLECLYVKRYLKTDLVFVEKKSGDKRSNLKTYVDLECTKTLHYLSEIVKSTFNVDVSTSTIDPALRVFHYTLKIVKLLEVYDNDKNFVFLDEVEFRGRNVRCEFKNLFVTAARLRNISVVAAINKYGMECHKIHERAVNGEEFKLFINEINKSCQR